jgi:PhnB protein
MTTTHIRHGFGAVRPYLYGRFDTDALIRLLGGEEIERHDYPKGGAHVEARIGDSIIVLEAADPPHASGTPASVYVYVPDADDALQRAAEAGFQIIAAAEDKPYKERAGGVKDSFGNSWWVSTYKG